MTDFKRDGSHLASCPPVEKWDDWVELDPEAWPRRVEKHYQLGSTICFNCESACGLLAYVDKETGTGRKVRRQSDASRPAAGGFAPKGRRRSIRFTIRTAFCIR